MRCKTTFKIRTTFGNPKRTIEDIEYYNHFFFFDDVIRVNDIQDLYSTYISGVEVIKNMFPERDCTGIKRAKYQFIETKLLIAPEEDRIIRMYKDNGHGADVETESIIKHYNLDTPFETNLYLVSKDVDEEIPFLSIYPALIQNSRELWCTDFDHDEYFSFDRE